MTSLLLWAQSGNAMVMEGCEAGKYSVVRLPSGKAGHTLPLVNDEASSQSLQQSNATFPSLRDCQEHAMTLAGLEPAIFGSEDQGLIH